MNRNYDFLDIPVLNKKRTGKQLKYFIEKNNLRPIDIQKYLNLTCIQTVYRWLNGVNIPSTDNLYALSWLFDVKIDDMLMGNAKEIPQYISIKKNRIYLLTYYIKLQTKLINNLQNVNLTIK